MTERIFDALPPVRGGSFARSWWGQAWLKTLEDSALDGKQVKAGRRLARAGAVGAVSVRPGRITAVVDEVRADVLVHRLPEADWDRLLDLVADRAGHLAALLDRDVPPDLADDASAVGVELLPGIGDLEPECACGGWDHCAHTVALCHQVARLLDRDPFVLLLMRGRGEDEILTALQRRTAGPPSGVPAREAFALRALVPPLPPLPSPPEPTRPPALTGTDHVPPELDVAALEFLATAAADLARRLLTETTLPDLTPHQDAVRLAALTPPDPTAERLADLSDRTPADLARAARAWHHGGPAALAALEDEWSPPELPSLEGELLTALNESGTDAHPRREGNRWHLDDDTQLRYGRDGRWWPFREGELVGPGERDAAVALGLLMG
ncbi:SWF or SNF family helicase [Streptomyces sp. AV19]|uniref:SWF or SNF family helicase n=1 Tax=Streptomyces sp. AV19 TaxID=2793068 RepID=UPI0018FE8281|nr:SWF or SNF family helicase [Streptomyces sp. AV19]MBH1937240.1 SWF or SNF family helicase [Streptomyces sp. AV19]MDG4536716.1 SWF or SNF family helicase [Streptomyces sp. AV19]